MNAQGHVATMLFERARENHLSGRLKEAEPLYRHALRLEPDHAESLHLLGLLVHQLGDPEQAAMLIAKAVERQPDTAHYLGSLGAAYRALGWLEPALQCFSRAVALRPDFIDGFCKIGMILHALGRLGEAEIAYRQALSLRPDLFDAHSNLGSALRDLGRPQEAHGHLVEARRLRPDISDVHNNLGNVLRDLDRFDESEACYHEALRLHPDYAEARFNLGALFRRIGRVDLAEGQYREALRLRPDHPETLAELGDLIEEEDRVEEALPLCRELVRVAPGRGASHRRLGSTLVKLGEFAEAERCLRRALELDPDDAEADAHLAVALYSLGRMAESERSCRRVLLDSPDDASLHNNLSMILLAQGRYEEAWPEWEWRWRIASKMPRVFPEPLWDGRVLEEGTLLLHAEQGLGDTLQFCRYVPMAAKRAKVILEVQPGLAGLLSQLPGVARIISRGENLPRFDWHCPLLSLPRAFGTTLETIPAAIPYLRAEPARIARWRTRLAACEGLRVGLVWTGNPRKDIPMLRRVDARRSLTLDHYGGLAGIPGVVFVSLQKGESAEQARHPPPGLVLHDWTDQLSDFTDTAALVEALDLVITVDTSVAHLAGALGKPVWMLNRLDSCWRWLIDRDDSPWYPTLRQFRQTSHGDWSSVISAVRNALIAAVS